jgi:adenosylhomocysteine nucleosidase
VRSSSPIIIVFCALACEAKPLVQAWKLKKLAQKHPFAIYANHDCLVVITGIGKIAMASAVGYTLALYANTRQPVLLNIGIAGHRFYSLGSIYQADKIVDSDTGKNYYPQLPFSVACATHAVATQSRPCKDYADDYLYDMEASAFFEAAIKFVSSELIHCLKIVSDNSQSPLENIDEHWVEECCAQQINVIDTLIRQLGLLKQSIPALDEQLYEQLCEEFHFTATNAAKLKTLLVRWNVLMSGERCAWRDMNFRNGKELINCLEKLLDETEFYL